MAIKAVSYLALSQQQQFRIAHDLAASLLLIIPSMLEGLNFNENV
jgi:hypothetical protein